MRETYIIALMRMLNRLSEKEIKRVYQLVEYLSIHNKKGGVQ